MACSFWQRASTNSFIRRKYGWFCLMCTPASGGARFSPRSAPATRSTLRREKGAAEEFRKAWKGHGEQKKNDDGARCRQPRIFPRSPGEVGPRRNGSGATEGRRGRDRPGRRTKQVRRGRNP